MTPCDFVTISGTPIPGVNGITTNYLLLADKHRTLSGSLRQDVLVHKREWRVPLILNGVEREAVIPLVNNNPSSRTVVIDGVGTVTAFVSITSDQRVRRRTRSGWDYLGGNLELLIEEA